MKHPHSSRCPSLVSLMLCTAGLLATACLQTGGDSAASGGKAGTTSVPGCDSGGGGIGNNPHCGTTQSSFLYSFTGGVDGSLPQGSLVLSNGKLYGATREGGAQGAGAIFSIKTDGTGKTTLHSFSGGADGAGPLGGLFVSGSTLYGMTNGGGNFTRGTIFKINTDGTNKTALYHFGATANDGISPVGELVSDGSALYGFTNQGGTHGDGTVFKININGTGMTTLHSFNCIIAAADGCHPQTQMRLILSGNKLYGMTQGGGSQHGGSIFTINTDGTGMTTLYSFVDPNMHGGVDGAHTHGSLILSSGRLYGMTSNGGTSGFGTVFSVKTDGTDMRTLYSFTGNADGAFPHGGLSLYSGKLYGMTTSCGEVSCPPNTVMGFGTIFSINTDGSGMTTLYKFTGPNSAGANPYADLLISDDVFYGMTLNGGTGNRGVVFGYSL